MGLFGNISESLSDLTLAFESLWNNPFHDDSLFKGISMGGAFVIQKLVSAVSNPILSVFKSLKSGAVFIAYNGLSG